MWLKSLLADGLLGQGQPELTRLQGHRVICVLKNICLSNILYNFFLKSLVIGLFGRVAGAGAGVFGWNRSRFFGTAPTPTLLKICYYYETLRLT